MPADDIGIAATIRLLQSGEIVAVPTETVYGLAADAANASAVARIYAAKGRPDFNPLVVHAADIDAASRLVALPEKARVLANAYWPGPLTLVAPRRDDARIAPAVSAGLAPLAIRCPAHPATQTLLRESGLALAAPSANRSGAISPSQASHVAADLGERIPLILDGGACSRGIESTIVAFDAATSNSSGGWRLLRPGPISRADIAALIGPESAASGKGIEAPGQMSSHYAPTKPLRLNALEPERDEWFIGFGAIAGDDNLSVAGDTAEAAAHLYAALHRADAADRARIAIAPIDGSMAEAINDRLRRASAH